VNHGEYAGTPLHLAAAQGHKDVVKLLVEMGANIDAKTPEGETPADLAEKYK
jgi:ankyrin repeat protein